MVDDELGGVDRIDLLRIATEFLPRAWRRSTTQGTPVKSCMMTRAGVKSIS
jgi:hypothetical protein